MKPASSRTFWLLYAAFILYGGTIPFHFIGLSDGFGPLVERWNGLSLNPWISPDTGGRPSIPDVVQNVLWFVPFGVLGLAAAGAPANWTWRRMAWITLLGACLSCAIEALQLLTRDRIASATDVVTNTAGTFVGVVATRWAGWLGIAGAARLKRKGLADVQELRPLLMASGALALMFLQPFDITLEVGTVVAHARGFLADPWQFTGLRDEGIVMLITALFSIATASYLAALGEKAAEGKAVAIGVLAVSGLEALQVLIGSRMPGLWDVAVGSTGVATGGILWATRDRTAWPVLWRTLLIGVTTLAAFLLMLSPFEFTSEYRGFGWFLFLGYYVRTTFETLSHVIELALLYVPLGFCFVMDARARTLATVAALALTLSIAAPVEYYQGWVVGRYPDISDVGLSLLGAWIGSRVARTVS